MRLQPYGWPLSSGEIAESQEQMMEAMRFMRDVLIKECDWTQLPDCQLPQETRDQWTLWRQYLRDLPDLLDSPMPFIVEITDPPEMGRPKDWNNWDLDRGAQLHGTVEL
jgi:hypothetical protein